jgi:(2R)-3-sulfolactate dehydrogenase (NADP+)
LRLGLADAERLAFLALTSEGAGEAAARSTARALVAAEASGQAGHGLSRVPSYCVQLRSGKVDGAATPVMTRLSPAVVSVDAAHGFAYPAIDLAIDALEAAVAATGIGVAVIRRSHHFGQAGAHVEELARRGMVALAFGNSPKAMALHGGRSPMLGTNPIAFACPAAGDPLVIDLALAVAARGKIVAAKASGDSIPAGWAVDDAGQPTTDPSAALAGSLLPIGGAKGSALALMVEILSGAVVGAAFGWEASSLFDGEGGPPNLGQVLIALDPQRLSGGAYGSRMADMAAAVQGEEGTRLPGMRRLDLRRRAETEGIDLPAKLHDQIVTLARTGAVKGRVPKQRRRRSTVPSQFARLSCWRSRP